MLCRTVIQVHRSTVTSCVIAMFPAQWHHAKPLPHGVILNRAVVVGWNESLHIVYTAQRYIVMAQ